MFTNEQLLAKLDSALKNITDVSQLGTSLLSEGQLDRFVEAMQHRTTVLPLARYMGMTAHTENVDRVGFAGRVLTAGTDKDSDAQSTSESWVNPDTNTNKLQAVELRGKAAITDRALRRNIEKGGFENHLVDLFGQAAGRDFEEWGLLADTATSAGILKLGNGWVKKAENLAFGISDAHTRDFDPADAEEILEAMLDALPKQFLINRAEWRFFVPYEVEKGYRNILKSRGTALGDEAQTKATPLSYEGIPVVYAPMLERSLGVAASPIAGRGRVAMLQHPDNMVWGVFHEVTIEPKRDAANRRTEFYLTIECDVHYEDENACAVALLDEDKPA